MRVVEGLLPWRDRIDQYGSWSGSPLDERSALESICFGDTLEGDELVFHPSDPDAIYLLPRHAERARKLGRGLAVAVAKIVRSKAPSMEPE